MPENTPPLPADRNKRWYLLNRERHKERQRQRYKANAENIRAKRKARYEANRDKLKAKQLEYYHRTKPLEFFGYSHWIDPATGTFYPQFAPQIPPGLKPKSIKLWIIDR